MLGLSFAFAVRRWLPAACRTAFAAPLLAALCAHGASAQQDGSSLPTVELSAGIHLIHAELADTDSARMRGLMFRRTLAPNHGMLFFFDEAASHCMWMRNTLLPLSVAFIDDKGVIVNIEEMKAQTDDTHCARQAVRTALEMDAGWFKAHGLGPGTAIKGIDKAAGRR
jgi:uncharacterized membrane protein (UPF0127 family)